jgi:hypothetical protein
MTDWSMITVNGSHGVLRSTDWVAGSSPSSSVAPVDGVFQPESQQWNNGSFWWDQDPSVNPSPVTWEVLLGGTYTVNRFQVQADDNDSYLLEYWNGTSWLTAYAIPFDCCFGLQTRDSGLIGPITTNRFRFTATGGDNYYSAAEIQAFAVPEPSTWALLILGFGVIGNGLRRHRRSMRPQLA